MRDWKFVLVYTTRSIACTRINCLKFVKKIYKKKKKQYSVVYELIISAIFLCLQILLFYTLKTTGIFLKCRKYPLITTFLNSTSHEPPRLEETR